MDLAALRNRRNNKSIKNIQESISQEKNKGYQKKEKDDRFWSLERDEAGNGSAVIRFLPTHENDDLPWVKLFHHSFKGPSGKWYIENSLSTNGLPDPVGEANSELWNTKIEANQKIVKSRKRKVKYFTNILVIQDKKNPENEGKVKLFTFGKALFDMISDKIQPTFEEDQPIDVFDIDEGANFKLRIRELDGYANYDKSEFSPPSPLADGDEERILEILNSQHSLKEFVSPDKFKTYDQLKKRFDEVVNGAFKSDATAEKQIEKEIQPKSAEKSAPAPEPKAEKKVPVKEVKKASFDDDDDDDDDMARFKGIVNDENPF